jgi:hypothetical protein
MRARKWRLAGIVTILLVGWTGWALGDVAATVDPGTIAWMDSGKAQSLGWRFFVDREITITHLGLYDAGDNGLAGEHVMGIWRVKKEGGLRLERWEVIGPGGVTEDHHVYAALREPLTIVPDPVPGAGGYERWLVGVWSPAGSTDPLIIRPVSAATLDIQRAAIIRFQNYTWKYWASYPDTTVTEIGNTPPQVPAANNWLPWGQVSDLDYFGVNFKYSTLGPAANAGPDDTIYTSEQAVTIISGTATHPVAGTAMQYRWLEGGTVLKDWADVGAEGAADLSLGAPVALLSVGSHTLTLEVKDAATTASDTMVLTVANTPPEAQLAPTTQVVEIGADAILITAEVADFDGDTLSYQWLKDGEVLDSGTITPPAGGAVIGLDDLVIEAGDPRFPLGLNEVQLVLSDSVNPSVNSSATVELKDTTAPTLAPTSSVNLLWPANHEMVPVTIWANAVHNGGGAVSLAARVQSSEPLDDSGDGSTEEDCILTSVDDATGTVLVQLRAERSGTGTGRVYTVTITASDLMGNQSTATVDIRVPHDRKKK